MPTMQQQDIFEKNAESPVNHLTDSYVVTREKIKPEELGFEQLKFIFKAVKEWLLNRKAEMQADIEQMLERLRHLYPRAYERLMAMIQQELSGWMLQPAPPIPLVISPPQSPPTR